MNVMILFSSKQELDATTVALTLSLCILTYILL